MRLYFGHTPEDSAEIDAQVRDFEGACCIIGMAVLVAAAGPEGFDDQELDVAMIGASPAEVTKMVLHGLASLVDKAWPNYGWSE